MHNNHKLTYLQLNSDEALFSHPHDFQGCLSVLAPIALENPTLGFCLLEHEIHLLLVGNETLAQRAMAELVGNLTGDKNHPLLARCDYQPVAGDAMTAHLVRLHQLPVTLGLVAEAAVYPWTSYLHYAESQAHWPWIFSTPLWRAEGLGQHGRCRSYGARHRALTSDLIAPIKTASSTLNSIATDLCADSVIHRVLSDHQVTHTQLYQRRMNRRRQHLAGIVAAVCNYVGIFDSAQAAVSEFFQLESDDLTALARSATRRAGQYIVQTGNELSDKLVIQRAPQVQQGHNVEPERLDAGPSGQVPFALVELDHTGADAKADYLAKATVGPDAGIFGH